MSESIDCHSYLAWDLFFWSNKQVSIEICISCMLPYELLNLIWVLVLLKYFNYSTAMWYRPPPSLFITFETLESGLFVTAGLWCMIPTNPSLAAPWLEWQCLISVPMSPLTRAKGRGGLLTITVMKLFSVYWASSTTQTPRQGWEGKMAC